MEYVVNTLKQFSNQPKFLFTAWFLVAGIMASQFILGKSVQFLPQQTLIWLFITFSLLLIAEILWCMKQPILRQIEIWRHITRSIDWELLPPEEHFLLFDSLLKNSKRICVRNPLTYYAKNLVNKGLIIENSMSVQSGHSYFFIKPHIWNAMVRRFHKMSAKERQNLELSTGKMRAEFANWKYL